MTAKERLEGALIKAERAKLHITNFKTDLKSFFDTQPYAVGKKADPQTRKLIYYMERVTPPPLHFGPCIGDVLFNLRSALDHLAQQLYLHGTGTTETSYHVCFPIYESATEYKAASRGKIKGMRQEAIDFIDGAKPYKGGNDALWRLNKLNNIDKHRLLVAVGGSFQSFNVGPSMSKQLADVMKEMDPTTKAPVFDIFLRPADNLCPLKVGNELYIGSLDLEKDVEMQFVFNIALHEPQIMKAEPIDIVLSDLANAVDSILNASWPLLE